jgi:hypothetical protein
MARHLDNEKRHWINSQLCAADVLQSSAKVGSALALGGFGAEDVVSQVARLLHKGRNGYLKDLKLTPLADHLDTVVSCNPHVMALGIASLPLDQAPVLSRFTSVARHEIVFMVLDLQKEPEKVYTVIWGKSVYKHAFAAVMFEFNDDSEVAGSYTELTFTESRYGLPYMRPGPDRTDAGAKECKTFLKSKGIKPLPEFFHSTSQMTFTDVLGFVHRWSVENPRYDIDAINCKAFARTMYRSFVAGEYRFCSDAGKDVWHKKVAHFCKGDLRSKPSSRAQQLPSSGYRDVGQIGSRAVQHGLSSNGFDADIGSLGPALKKGALQNSTGEDYNTGHARHSDGFELEFDEEASSDSPEEARSDSLHNDDSDFESDEDSA